MSKASIPPWIVAGGLLLTLGAGMINAVGFLGVHHQAITHLTGTVSIMGIESARADYSMAGRAFLVIVFFFLGAVLSGFIIQQSSLRLGRRYGVALTIESLLLLAAVYYFQRDAFTGDYLASMACGLQNALATGYSGAVIRTTHLTGIVTDLGLASGHFLRHQPVDWSRFRLHSALLLGFFAGSVIGALGFTRHGYNTLLAPAVLTGIAGLGYTLYRHFRRVPVT